MAGLSVASLSRLTPQLVFTRIQHASTSSTGPSLQLVARLRKRTTVTIQKAREALIASNGDIAGALSWIENDRVITGQRKAAKVGGRFAGEGLIGISVLSGGAGKVDYSGVRAAMVELNCETDFVGKNELFRKLAQDLAFTAAFITDPQAHHKTDSEALLQTIDPRHLLDAPLMVRGRSETGTLKTVSEAIRDAITAVGENIRLRRAAALVHNPVPLAAGFGLRTSSYVHGALTSPMNENPSSSTLEVQGRIGALVAIGLRTLPASRLRELLQCADFNNRMGVLERALARQVVGLKPDGVRGEVENALYNQSFDMLPNSGGQSVEQVLSQWVEEQNMIEGNPQAGDEFCGMRVIDFLRWEVGEGL